MATQPNQITDNAMQTEMEVGEEDSSSLYNSVLDFLLLKWSFIIPLKLLNE